MKSKIDKYYEDENLRKDVVDYALNILKLEIPTTMAIITLALLLGELKNIILYMAFFIPLRIYSGGYHANTRLKCFIFSVLSNFIVIVILKNIEFNNYMFLFILMADFVFYKISPVDSPNRRYDSEETMFFRKRSLKILFIENIILLISFFLDAKSVLFTATLAIVTVFILLVAQKIKD